MNVFDRYPTLKTMIVNTPDYSFRGVLWKRRAGYLILRNAEMLKGKGETVPMDGEVLIPRERVQFIQVVGGAPRSERSW